MPAYEKLTFEHLLDVPVHSLALGKPPKVAVLADAPYIFDGERFVRRELPPGLRAEANETEHVEIFFGRDNEPRLLGTRTRPDGSTEPVYLRHRPSGWRTEPSELGPLAGVRRGLYGVLGFADPEVVCSPGLFCLVKRVSGWARIDADPEPVPMFWTEEGVYKVVEGALVVLEGSDWKVAQPSFQLAPTSLCHRTEEERWMTESGSVYLQANPSVPPVVVDIPVNGARTLHCASGGAVWVAGTGGIARLDREGWKVPPGDFGALEMVASRGEELWLGGERGAFRGRPAQPD